MALPTDPLFSAQWHLRNTASGEFDLNVVDVWDSYTGAGVQVAVFDDGVQGDHPDLAGNYSTVKDYDLGSSSETMSLAADDNHGTSVAGIIAAVANNGIGVVGIAYGATIFGLRGNFPDEQNGLSDPIKVATGEMTIGGVDRTADIVNMSLGTLDTTNFFDRASSSLNASAAMDYGVVNGRAGKGTIFVKAAGNERTQVDDNQTPVPTETNLAAWNANPHSISVAAVQRTGFIDDYSTYGSSILVSAFGSPEQIQTTDRTGADGYNATEDYASDFNGTSAASPEVAGVVALMLQANSNLGWRDVQTILANSSRHVGSAVGSAISGFEKYQWAFNGAETWNGGGLHFSNDYGFGLVDAKAAVRLAETWGTSAATSQNQASASLDLLNSSLTLAGNGTTSSVQGTDSNGIKIEHVRLSLDFSQYYDIADLELRVVGPDGTTSIVLDNPSIDNDEADSAITGRWDYFYTNAFRGMSSSGTWRVELIDADDPTTSPITVEDVVLTFFGAAASDDDIFIFTREFSDYAGQSGHGTTISGGAGTDTLNAAAVDSASTVNLGAGTGTIDGVAVTLSGFENVYTGDGNDQVTGNGSANIIKTGRGNDSVFGLAGGDSVFAGTGNDAIEILSGSNQVAGEAGVDTVTYSGKASTAFTFVYSGVIVTVNESADNSSSTLTNVELATFSDRTIDLRNGPNSTTTEIYRFYNADRGTHFFTASAAERDYVAASLPEYAFEGNAFGSNTDGNSGGTAIFRFYNTSSGAHFYTASEAERDHVIANLPTFQFEGTSFYAYMASNGSNSALFRFYNNQNGAHFYTTSEAERDYVISTLSHYTYEGVAFYIDAA